MLGKRITEPRQYISLYDPALSAATAKELARYRVTRDIDDLGDWKTWPDQPTVFTIKPLEAGFGHLADDMGFMARRQLFMLHVEKVAGMDGMGEQAFETGPGGARSLTAEALELFPEKVVDEIATVVTELAGSDTVGFTVPDGWLEYLRSSPTNRAILARTGSSANESSSD
jgi:hypothetical protein